MVIEQKRIVNTETRQGAVSAKVQEAFKLWSSDSTNEEVAKMMNDALDEAYVAGVPIAVKIAHGANGSTPDVNEQVCDKLGIKDKIEISTYQDEHHSSRINRAKVYAFANSGYLHLDVIEGGKRLNIANLKPNQIGFFTPVITPG